MRAAISFPHRYPSHLIAHARRYPRCVLAAVAMTALAGSAGASVWTNPAGGDFQTGSNWDTGVVPGASDWVYFQNDNLTTGTVTFSADAATQGMTLKNTTGTITFDIGAGRKYTHSLYTIMGDGATPALQKPSLVIASGEVQSNLVLIGNNDHTEGHVTVSGPSSIYTATGSIRVGSDSGSNSTLRVENGGSAVSQGDFFVGLQKAMNCDVTVTDPGSKLTATNTMQVGGDNSSTVPAGHHTVSVLNGAEMTLGRVLIAVGNTQSSGGNTFTVSGANSKLTLTAIAGTQTTAGYVGLNFPDNTLAVVNGGQVVATSGDIRVGSAAASINNVVQLGGGSTITLNGPGTLATAGSGRFDVRRGKLWLDGGTGYFPALLANTGATSVLQLDGGVLNVGNAEVNNGSPLQLGNGAGATATYRMTDAAGTHTFANGLAIQSDGRLEGSGAIVGNVSGAAGAVVSPGASPGIINVTGDWDNHGIDVLLQLGNYPSAAPILPIDQLLVSGNFTQGGIFTVDTSQFVPPDGAAYFEKLVGWTASLGDFSDTTVISSLPYEFRSDGFYVMVPEPASCLALAAFACLAMTRARRCRS